MLLRVFKVPKEKEVEYTQPLTCKKHIKNDVITFLKFIFIVETIADDPFVVFCFFQLTPLPLTQCYIFRCDYFSISTHQEKLSDTDFTNFV